VGVDLDVIFAARLTAEQAFALPERLNTTLAVVAACRAYYKHAKPYSRGLELERWQWVKFPPAITAPSVIAQAWASPRCGSVQLSGTPGYLQLHPNRVRYTGGPKLSGFAANYEGCQNPIRQVCRAIARALDSDRVIYLPDSGDWPAEVGELRDYSFDESLARLTAWGPPVSVLGALGYGRAVRSGFHYADGALRRADGTVVPQDEIVPGRDWVWSAGVTRYADGRLVPAEELARPDLRGGFAYYVDDFRDLP
jgi:hypothetical protein